MTIIPVKIEKIRQETPKVRVIRINLQGQEFEYKPGQWIDCYTDNKNENLVVGYSIASSPTEKCFIELVVKISDNPVTQYIHSQAKKGDTLYIEGGQGSIFYEKSMSDKVVLVGAGIGVAPLIGIFRYIDEASEASAVFFQSASSKNELIYYDELRERANKNPRLSYIPYVSRGDSSEGIGEGRITGEVFEENDVDWSSLFYLSGPKGMIPSLERFLLSKDVEKSRILYEVWW